MAGYVSSLESAVQHAAVPGIPEHGECTRLDIGVGAGTVVRAEIQIGEAPFKQPIDMRMVAPANAA